jgi:hypothetical protein
MSNRAVFAGLVYDEFERPVEMTVIGGEAFYVVNDSGFRRHIDADVVDRPVITMFVEQIRANKDLAVGEALRMLGQDDLFTKAALDASIETIDTDQIIAQGIPPQARDMIGMMGFRIIINLHGEVVDIRQPTIAEDEGD